ncbi:MAG: AAA family ATPase [Actinomycetota bacterium]|nr:AAA family ATPase [Actinomycetota bacterium]
MLTKLTIRNLKRFQEASIELGDLVVFIGPNDSGKTTALQALALWDIGLKRWNEKRGGKAAPEKRPGVTINRRDLIAVPVPDANLLWRDLHVRDVSRTNGKQQTRNIRVDIIVEGVSAGTKWTCGLEFDYANEESFYCRPLRLDEDAAAGRMSVPSEATDIKVAYLQPMSGLSASETRLDAGAINVAIGEGRTAEVLRNLCFQLVSTKEGDERFGRLVETVNRLFGIRLERPRYVAERGEITMTYRNAAGVRLDLASAGRGLLQTVLLVAYVSLNPGSVLLLDEPDAHLEILRQRQIYELLSQAVQESESQIIAASHSEVILNEAADRDMVVAFVGPPHRIDDRGAQVLKSLKDIGFEQYYQADLTGWVLYLEGSTDLAILRQFARILDHPAVEALERPFVTYVQNQPPKAHSHFYGLREARPNLVAFALFDRLPNPPTDREGFRHHTWSMREIENYLANEETLLRWAETRGKQDTGGALLGAAWRHAMEESITEISGALKTLGQDPWSADVKVSDAFLDPLFVSFFKRLNLPNLMRKTDYHQLAIHVDKHALPPEVATVLTGIHDVYSSATSRQ